MRIIAGKLKGTNLHLPQDKITRPLKDRARESIFNLLTHSNKMLRFPIFRDGYENLIREE